MPNDGKKVSLLPSGVQTTRLTPEQEKKIAEGNRQLLMAALGTILGGLGGSPMSVLTGLAGGLDKPREDGILEGYIPTPANFTKFIGDLQQKLKGVVPLVGESGVKNDPSWLARAYMAVRYPNRYNQVASDIRVQPPADLNTLGSFNPVTKDIRLVSHSTTAPKSLIGTIAHESQHSIDFERAGKGLASYKGQPIEQRNFFTPDRGGTYQTGAGNYDAYRNQTVEAKAFQAGSTAEQSAQRFFDMVQKRMAGGGRMWNDLTPLSPARAQQVLDGYKDLIQKRLTGSQDLSKALQKLEEEYGKVQGKFALWMNDKKLARELGVMPYPRPNKSNMIGLVDHNAYKDASGNSVYFFLDDVLKNLGYKGRWRVGANNPTYFTTPEQIIDFIMKGGKR